MPTTLTRILAAAALVLAVAWVAPQPASALEPFRPLPGYHPTFATETDSRPWIDCLWASGSMLVEKWTNGVLTVDHRKLRDLSGDKHGGSTFVEMRVAYAKLGLDLKYSPDGGAPMTWAQLLGRLKAGGGAVVLGDYGQLPRYFGRWDHGFWKGLGRNDNHAVYVERYDARRGRVWLMDPLARGASWRGEWVSVRALRRFAWFARGRVYAAVTPAARPAPFAGVQIGTKPSLAVSWTSVAATWSLKAPRGWTMPAVDAKATFRPAADPRLAAIRGADMGVLPSGAKVPAKPTMTRLRRALQLSAEIPYEPGAYEATLSFKERRFGRTVAAVDAVPVFVAGPRQATIRIDARRRALVVGLGVKVSLSVANSGELTWADEVPDAGPHLKAIHRATRVVASWVPLELTSSADGTIPVFDAAKDRVLHVAPLAPGKLLRATAELAAPAQPGRWALVVDVVDDVDGSFAALGSRPAVLVFDVVDDRGLPPVE